MRGRRLIHKARDLTPFEVRRVIALLHDGRNYTFIAERIGIPVSQVQAIARANEITPKRGW